MFFLHGKLRWKQVRILHGPATVLTEFCPESTELQCLGRRGKAMRSESGNMHKHTGPYAASDERRKDGNICTVKTDCGLLVFFPHYGAAVLCFQ